MTHRATRLNWRRRLQAAAMALMVGAGLSTIGLPRAASAEDLIDLTLLFHGSVQGKIAPCG